MLCCVVENGVFLFPEIERVEQRSNLLLEVESLLLQVQLWNRRGWGCFDSEFGNLQATLCNTEGAQQESPRFPRQNPPRERRHTHQIHSLVCYFLESLNSHLHFHHLHSFHYYYYCCCYCRHVVNRILNLHAPGMLLLICYALSIAFMFCNALLCWWLMSRVVWWGSKHLLFCWCQVCLCCLPRYPLRDWCWGAYFPSLPFLCCCCCILTVWHHWNFVIDS